MSTSMDQGNRTFIGSVVFVDIVGYSKKSVSDQITMKDRFTSLLSESLHGISLEQRIILDTGDGAALSFIGDPEDALFVGMNIRDLLNRQAPDAAPPNDDSTSSGTDLFLRIGINLGPIKLVRDINGQPNIVGDGINVAQRIMSFASPGQVVVSRSFFDVVSVISDEYAQLFKYEGSRTDKHVREHEIYVVGDSAAAFNKAKSGMEDRAAATNPRNNKSAGAPNAKSTGDAAANGEAEAEGVPFFQDKKKLTMVGGALGAVVLVLAIMLAVKKPAAVDVPAPTAAKDALPAVIAAKPADVIAPPAAPAAKLDAHATAPAPMSATPDKSAATKTAGAAAAEPTKPAVKSDVAKTDTTKTEPAKAPAAVVMGTVSFSIQPWGEVLINGKSIGTSPPIKQYKLPPGKHKVEVRNSTFTPLVTSLDVKPKDELTIRHQFK